MPQSFESHAHQPVPTLVASALWLLAVLSFVAAVWFGWNTRDVAFVLVLAAMFVALSIDRLYTTKLQDRIIMLEMKVRCAEVLPAGDASKLARLGAKQVAALRFASDQELGALLDRAVREQLEPKAIKQAIKTWRPDHHRT
jgi:Family of unknown function (DUF6526)